MLLLNSKLNGKNKVLAINTWAVTVLRYKGRGVRLEKRRTTSKCKFNYDI